MSFATSLTNKSTKKCRIVILGDMSVGKTSIIQKFTTGQFDQANNPTIGIDFNKRDLKYNQQIYRLQMWDTAGQQRYQSLIPTYLKNANFAILVFDVTRIKSFENIQKWFKMFRQYQQSSCIIVGNKSDLTVARKVDKKDIDLLAKKLQCQYIQVSAKNGKNIDNIFETIVKRLSQQQFKEKLMGKNNQSNAETVDTMIKQEVNDKKVKLSTKKVKKQEQKTNSNACCGSF